METNGPLGVHSALKLCMLSLNSLSLLQYVFIFTGILLKLLYLYEWNIVKKFEEMVGTIISKQT